MRKIFYRDAILEALDEEMARDDMVMMIGEDIGVGDGTWKCSKGLREKYGDLRMKDSPISENGFTGMCIGMALTGLRPISEIMFEDFALCAMDQIVNQMNKVCYMSGGQKSLPMVIRTTIGAGRAAAAQHSQNLTAALAHFPGAKIVMPSDAYTAKGLLKSAIRDNNPVIVVEHRKQFSMEYDMPDDADENLLLPLGKSQVVREGKDITVIASSFQVGQMKKVAKHLAKQGVSVELIDLQSIVPLDRDTIIKSVKKTGKLLIIDEGCEQFGVPAEITANILPDVFYDLDAPITRLCAPNCPVPFSPALEKFIVPNERTMLDAIQKLL
jgi:acetoin:2,6-dichlorophenolindophenol oxidoreductase subunit beta